MSSVTVCSTRPSVWIIRHLTLHSYGNPIFVLLLIAGGHFNTAAGILGGDVWLAFNAWCQLLTFAHSDHSKVVISAGYANMSLVWFLEVVTLGMFSIMHIFYILPSPFLYVSLPNSREDRGQLGWVSELANATVWPLLGLFAALVAPCCLTINNAEAALAPLFSEVRERDGDKEVRQRKLWAGRGALF